VLQWLSGTRPRSSCSAREMAGDTLRRMAERCALKTAAKWAVVPLSADMRAGGRSRCRRQLRRGEPARSRRCPTAGSRFETASSAQVSTKRMICTCLLSTAQAAERRIRVALSRAQPASSSSRLIPQPHAAARDRAQSRLCRSPCPSWPPVGSPWRNRSRRRHAPRPGQRLAGPPSR
jgi:hypothetical protein